jgi:hypothetical protein
LSLFHSIGLTASGGARESGLVFGLTAHFNSDFFDKSQQFNLRSFAPTAFRVTISFSMTRVPSTATTFTDQMISDGGLQTGLIVGVVISATFMIGAVAIGLIFMKRRQKTPQRSEDQSSPTDIQFVGDTAESTTDEALVSYHDSFTYEGGASVIRPFVTPSIPGIGQDVVTLSLI